MALSSHPFFFREDEMHERQRERQRHIWQFRVRRWWWGGPARPGLRSPSNRLNVFLAESERHAERFADPVCDEDETRQRTKKVVLLALTLSELA
ncbi:hypothetical protein CGRA01v4_11864 [Colletotrichum graminicola]|nr:hypothetical protein CGRA01v4_11864 [Colletotrichum graminicola]